MEQGKISSECSAGSFIHRTDDPNSVDRPSGMAAWLLEYNVAGGARVVTSSDSFVTMPGSFLLFRAGVAQCYSLDPAQELWDHIWFCFTPRSHWHSWLEWPSMDVGISHLELSSQADHKYLTGRMRRGVEMHYSACPGNNEFVMNTVEEVLLYCDLWKATGSLASMDPRIRMVQDLMCRSFDRQMAVADLAGMIGLSPSRFAHLFKSQVGQSPMRYLEQRRLEKACELLRMTQMSIANVSEATGFSCPFYFSRLFKDRMKSSPSSYRRQL